LVDVRMADPAKQDVDMDIAGLEGAALELERD
jgi:hypothetical protein